jgi:hypothetical protein
VFENRVLRKILGPKREEVAGGWKRLHNEKLRNLYTSLNIIWVSKSKRVRWAGHVVCTEGMRNAFNISVGKSEWKGLLGRSRHMWEIYIRMNLMEIG